MQLEKREIVTAIILSIVTCGIYGIIWGVKIAKDSVKVKNPEDDALAEILLVIFLPFIGFYLCEKKLTEGCRARGIPHDDNSVLYLILGLFGLGIVDYCLMQSELNKLAEAGFVFDAQQPNYYQQQGGYGYTQPNYPPQNEPYQDYNNNNNNQM
ncbi:MAG: DUF4234 domain-containing protein [Clostridia bacterium]|nr:DUF4234 domain-containing protein [Clostridia bacterium]